ncbi:MAG: hypothetical protein IT340_01095 [Chloroflexi bacterium]|nr:hypothetical protein [Chloroflexota bacterium]
MLRHRHGIALLLVFLSLALVGGTLAWVGDPRSPAPVEPAGPPGRVAEAAGLAVTYDPQYAGLAILTTDPGSTPVATGRAGWREIMRFTPGAVVNGAWEPALAPAAQHKAPTLVVREETDTVVVHLDDFQIGDAARSSWSLALSRTVPVVTLDRVDRLLRPGEVSATGLMVQSTPTAVRDRLVLVCGTAYTLSDQPITRLGNHGLHGVVHRDPALTFTATSAELTRARGERDSSGHDRLLLYTDRPPVASASIQTSIRFQVGQKAGLQQASSSFSPAVEAFLLTAGYYGNVFVSESNGRVLTASMTSYPDSVWIRDVAMATKAYGYVLDDSRPFRNTLAQFLRRTSADGVVPEFFDEAGNAENRGAWDAMPDLIHGVYAYTSKTRDVGFVTEHFDTLVRVRDWIRRLDTNDDGLPDRDIYPYGYFDSVENGVMHTYAIASFYLAHLELAELAELIGRDGVAYRDYAERMRFAYNRPLDMGGYWQPERGYPIAWKKADGRLVDGFETFGILMAVRVGLITDDERLRALARLLRERREEFINQNAFPLRLMLGGYDAAFLRSGVPPARRWLLDANAPWVVGHDVAVRARFGALDDAAYMLARYEEASMQYPPMAEFGAAPNARHGGGETHDGGRLWDNGAWFDAVYGTHFGLRPTPRALIIQPNPLRRVADDQADGLLYQNMRFRLVVRADSYTLTVLDGPARTVAFYPTGRYQRVAVNGGPQQPTHTMLVRPGESYTVQSFGSQPAL